MSTGGGTLASKATKTVTTINLCRSTFNKFIIVTPAVNIDRDCDGGPGTVDMEVVMEEANGLGLSRTIAVVRDENNNDSNNYRDSYGGQSDCGQSSYNNNNTPWNQWWCSLVYSAVRCFGSGSATAAGTTTKLLQPCQYRRGWLQQRRRCEEKQKVKMKWDMNNNGFYSRRGADGTYEL